MVQDEKWPPPAKKDITSHLERILASPDFDATPRQKAVLKYIVSQTLTGKASEISDDTLAAEVFGRGTDYDSITDPIVIIQTDMLRRALARYYKTAVKSNPIRIDIPQGTYVPVFQKQKPNDS